MSHILRCLCFLFLSSEIVFAQTNAAAQAIPPSSVTTQLDSETPLSAMPTAYYPSVFPQRPKTIGSIQVLPINRTPMIDSLVPTRIPAPDASPSDSRRPSVIIVIFILSALGICTLLSVVIFMVRRHVRKAAIKRRRQASWILRSSQWDAESKGCAIPSSSNDSNSSVDPQDSPKHDGLHSLYHFATRAVTA
ncbi:hypothetical protein BV22DRAFT_1031962 [Leucogyrophana mollusca]|uniref:Uncharacterized protein n=1 Tax=Leucogyrophana mollusca TaxID=85980 RepID=A0ACB8BPC9_9AGAM|nr:hypothetical protein BV22DRAFT_1031962 [Leucogyrophana mollusca]